MNNTLLVALIVGLYAMMIASSLMYRPLKRRIREYNDALLELLQEMRLTLEDLSRIDPEREETYQLGLDACHRIEKRMRRLQAVGRWWKRDAA